MRLNNISNYEQANAFLIDEFLPWYNSNFSLNVESTYRALPKDINLDLVFSKKF